STTPRSSKQGSSAESGRLGAVPAGVTRDGVGSTNRTAVQLPWCHARPTLLRSWLTLFATTRSGTASRSRFTLGSLGPVTVSSSASNTSSLVCCTGWAVRSVRRIRYRMVTTSHWVTHLPRQRSAPNTTAAARTPMPTYTSDVLIVMSISPTARPSSTITRLMTGRGPRLAPMVRRREGELRGVGALLPVSGSGVSAGGSALFDCPPPADPPPGGPPPGGPPPGGPPPGGRPPGGWFPPGGPAGGLPWPGSRRGSCGRCGPGGRCGGACDGPCCRCGPGGAVRLGGGPLGPLG